MTEKLTANGILIAENGDNVTDSAVKFTEVRADTITVWQRVVLVIGWVGGTTRTDLSTAPGSATATLHITSNGTPWATPTSPGLGAGYEVRITHVSGTVATGTSTTWLSLSTTRSASVTTGTGSTDLTVNSVVKVAIRETGGPTLFTQNVSLSATRNAFG